MIAALMVVAATAASDGASSTGQARALDAVVACRRIADTGARLDCYDREVAAFDRDVQARKVVVLDQEQTRKARRSLFGFPLPSLKLFGGDDDDKSPEITRIDTVVTASSRTGDGRIAFTVEDGARWVQDDDRTLMLARVKPGSKVRIARGALGSYFATFDGGGSAKVRRER